MISFFLIQALAWMGLVLDDADKRKKKWFPFMVSPATTKPRLMRKMTAAFAISLRCDRTMDWRRPRLFHTVACLFAAVRKMSRNCQSGTWRDFSSVTPYTPCVVVSRSCLGYFRCCALRWSSIASRRSHTRRDCVTAPNLLKGGSSSTPSDIKCLSILGEPM